MSNDYTLSLVITMLFMKHKNINTKITAAEITAAVVLCQKVLIFDVYKEISTIILYQNDGAYMCFPHYFDTMHHFQLSAGFR